MRTEREAHLALEKHADTIRRICFYHLKNQHDAEDVFQDVFLKYILYDGLFESEDHEKAWLIRVAINCCKNLLKSFFRRKVTSLHTLTNEPFIMPEESQTLLETVCKLPEHYRDVIYLFYYEGYTAVEIASLLGKSENTVYTWLSRAKARLKTLLGGERFEG